MARRGTTFIELLIGLFLLAMVLLSLIWMNRTSNRAAMDSYYEMVALSLAREPIEVFRGFGYAWLSTYDSHPIDDFPTFTWKKVTGAAYSVQQRPIETEIFQRHIALENVEEAGVPAIRVRVSVSPIGASWLTRHEISLEGLIVKQNPCAVK